MYVCVCVCEVSVLVMVVYCIEVSSGRKLAGEMV